jgi:Fur family peroxide stress response transcriptional regulator
MNVSLVDIRKKLSEIGLNVTPWNIAILESIYMLDSQPTAENIIAYIRQTHPNIATGTVYKVLETLIEKNLIKKVSNYKDIWVMKARCRTIIIYIVLNVILLRIFMMRI